MAKKKIKRGKDDSEKSYAVPHNGQSSTVHHVSDAACSLEFSRDAKGQPRWGLKLYGDRDEMNAVLDETLALDERLREETRGNG